MPDDLTPVPGQQADPGVRPFGATGDHGANPHDRFDQTNLAHDFFLGWIDACLPTFVVRSIRSHYPPFGNLKTVRHSPRSATPPLGHFTHAPLDRRSHGDV